MIAGELASNSVRGQIALPKYIQSIYHYIPSGTLSRFASLILILQTACTSHSTYALRDSRKASVALAQ